MKKIFENIKYYCWDIPYSKYRTIRHWFYCNFNRTHFRLVWRAWNSYGWDYGYLLELEEAQIDKQILWFKNHQIMVDEQYKQICRTLKWAKHCLHILNDDTELFHFNGQMEFNNKLEHFKEVTKFPEYVYDGPTVNFRNASRFLNKSTQDLAEKMPNILYEAKCRKLYYKIREKYTEIWWD